MAAINIGHRRVNSNSRDGRINIGTLATERMIAAMGHQQQQQCKQLCQSGGLRNVVLKNQTKNEKSGNINF
jgi:hypothetical protein